MIAIKDNVIVLTILLSMKDNHRMLIVVGEVGEGSFGFIKHILYEPSFGIVWELLFLFSNPRLQV